MTTRIINRWVALLATIGTVVLGLVLSTGTAHANEHPAFDMKTGPSVDAIVWGTCPNLKDFYVNEDETADQPEATQAGLKFTGKDLIHHKLATPMDLADVRAGSFTATGDPDKVVIKMETDTPYASIIQTPDGKFWSSKIPAGQTGGQSHPVDAVVDLVGLPALPGKTFTENTHVVTFGLGYWTENGSTVVSSLTFHGVTYPLTCAAPHTGQPSGSPSHTTPITRPRPSISTTHPAVAGAAGNGGAGKGGALAITGPGSDWLIGSGAAVLVAGALMTWVTYRRRVRFSA